MRSLILAVMCLFMVCMSKERQSRDDGDDRRIGPARLLETTGNTDPRDYRCSLYRVSFIPGLSVDLSGRTARYQPSRQGRYISSIGRGSVGVDGNRYITAVSVRDVTVLPLSTMLVITRLTKLPLSTGPIMRCFYRR